MARANSISGPEKARGQQHLKPILKKLNRFPPTAAMLNGLRPIKKRIVEAREFQLFRSSTRPLQKQKKILYALTPPPILPNVGDHAQAVAIHQWLKKHFPGLPVVEVTKSQISPYMNYLKWLINEEDIIIIHSGGNLGDRGIWSETGRRLLIKEFTNNRVVSLPQTIFFSQTEKGEREKKISEEIYNKHPRLTVLGRDPVSGKLAAELFPNALTGATPDFVLSLPPRKIKPKSSPPKILLCLRGDNESILSEEKRKELIASLPYPCKRTDTTISSLLPLAERERYTEKVLSVFEEHDAVVTDRYHGLIFAVLCRKPTVVLPTVDHKLTSAMDWFQDIPFIRLVENVSDVSAALRECLNSPIIGCPDWNELYFDRLPRDIHLLEHASLELPERSPT